jgi:hypothetical protein
MNSLFAYKQESMGEANLMESGGRDTKLTIFPLHILVPALLPPSQPGLVAATQDEIALMHLRLAKGG